jgi:hypothetical protein
VLADVVGPSLRWATARLTNPAHTSTMDEQPHDTDGHEARPRQGRASVEINSGALPGTGTNDVPAAARVVLDADRRRSWCHSWCEMDSICGNDGTKCGDPHW